MQRLELGPFSAATGTVRLPGSKSISNRALLLAALANGTSTLDNLLESEDTRIMLAALTQLGINWQRETAPPGVRYRVAGANGALRVKRAELFVGNAGTVARPLTAALALSGGEYLLAGTPRMHERPIGDLVDGLRAVGAQIDYKGQTGFPPLAIHPAPIAVEAPIRVRGSVSSQFLSALLLALPLVAQRGARDIIIEVDGELISKPYVALTLELLARYGIAVAHDGWRRFTLPAGAHYQSPGHFVIEGDASSASYFLAAGAIGGGPVRVEGVGRTSLQGDLQFAEVLAQMGAQVVMGDDWIEVRGIKWEGQARRKGHEQRRLAAIALDCQRIPDAAMTVAVAALFADGPSTLHHIGSWRVKETDRVAAMAAELRKLGANIEIGSDSLRITPPAALVPGVTIETYDDHRIAMCFSLISLAGIPVTINDPQCVAKTFPDYFDRFLAVAQP